MNCLKFALTPGVEQDTQSASGSRCMHRVTGLYSALVGIAGACRIALDTKQSAQGKLGRWCYVWMA